MERNRKEWKGDTRNEKRKEKWEKRKKGKRIEMFHMQGVFHYHNLPVIPFSLMPISVLIEEYCLTAQVDNPHPDKLEKHYRDVRFILKLFHT